MRDGSSCDGMELRFNQRASLFLGERGAQVQHHKRNGEVSTLQQQRMVMGGEQLSQRIGKCRNDQQDRSSRSTKLDIIPQTPCMKPGQQKMACRRPNIIGLPDGHSDSFALTLAHHWSSLGADGTMEHKGHIFCISA